MILIVAAGAIAYAATGPLRARQTATAQPRATFASPSGPRIEFASLEYNFGKAPGDSLVDCLFTFTNTGNALLEVTAVNPGCGCMKAGEWTRKVEPGRTGTIPVKYDSHHYPAGPFWKSVTVLCNDKSMPETSLQIKGTVWRPFELFPQSVALNLSAEAPSNSTSVRITNHLDQPLFLSDLMNDNPSLHVELQTNIIGQDYQINVHTVPPWPTNFQMGHVLLKTSYTNSPLLDIPSYVRVQPVLMAVPSIVRLPPSPLTNAVTTFVQVRNFGTNPVNVSEPSVSIAGVATELKVDDPGKLVTVQMEFPAGFVIPPGSNAELHVKTDHPLYRDVKVPILQVSRPAAPTATAPPIKLQ